MARKKPTVEFRCPHTAGEFASKAERTEARAARYEVPADAEWQPVMAPVRAGVTWELEPTGTFYADVTCPTCGATIQVVTDQAVA